MPTHAREERGHPPQQAALREGHHGHAKSGSQKGRVTSQAKDTGALRSLAQGIKVAALRFRHEQHDGSEQKSGACGNVERSAPAKASSEVATYQVAKGEADRNREIEDSQNAATLGFRKQVSHEGRRDGYETRLAATDQSMPD